LRQQLGEEARWIAADFLIAKREVVDAVEQHRQSLGGAKDVEEGVEAGCGGVPTQESFPQLVPSSDPELLVGTREQCFDPLLQAPCGWPVRGQDQDPLGGDAVLDQAGEAPRQRLGLAGPGDALEQQ
jgi:hypothetical protein